jgi:cyclopropane-fatty-acyl-phospholipid synthase
MKQIFISLMEKGMISDGIIRMGIRYLLRRRIQQERRNLEGHPDSLLSFIDKISQGPIAVQTEKPKEQHYELSTSFYQHILGKRLKYSCNYWPENVSTLDASEEAMLKVICERAEIQDGMDILDLGCGWGALSLWLAEHYPGCRIYSVSHSASQGQYIEEKCRQGDLKNITVQTSDMNDFHATGRFDRVVSIEMFEHMRNLELLMSRISGWLNERGKLFVHIFCHRKFPYFFETRGSDNWMGRYFFTAGMMPSEGLLLSVQSDFFLQNQWRVNGMHYRKTAEQWLRNMDSKRDQVIPVLESIYGRKSAARWFQRWRIFFMACSELWGYNRGEEWFVSHYLFHKA